MGIFGSRKPYMGAQIREDANAPKLTDLLGQSTGETQMPWDDAPQAMPKPKSSFFGQGGIGRILLGSIGDALSGQPIYREAMQQRQRQEYEDQLYQRRSAQEWADFTRKHDYEVAHPKAPAPNDTERDYQFILEKDGPEAAQLWLKNRYDPIVNIPLPDGVYLGPRSQLPSTVGGAPVKTQPKGQLRPYGGPMPSASGGFR